MTQPPTVVIQNAPTSVANTTPFNVTFEFSEDVTGFTLGDITVGNGAASNLVAVDGNTYTAEIAPSGAGNVAINVPAGVVQDGAGNNNVAAPQVTVVFIGSGSITIIKKITPAIAGNGTFTYSSAEADLNGLTLVTNGNTATSASFVKLAGSYAVTEGEQPEWRLKSIACVGDADGGSVVDLSNRRVTIDMDGGEGIVCTFTSVRDEDYVRARTRRVISNFMSRRADQITASDPDLVGRMSEGGGTGSGSPVGFTANGTPHNNQMTFSTSLRQIVGSGQAAKVKRREELGQMMALGQQSLIGTTVDDGTGFDVWLKGQWARVTNETRESDIGLLYVGVDYRFSSSLLVGFLTQFDWTDEIDRTENTAADGQGWLAGPYVVARMNESLLFDGRFAWGQSANNVNPLGLYTDAFDTNRWLARGRLTGDFNQGNWHFAPHVGLIYFEENQKGYTDSLGISIPGQTISLGRITFGPNVSTQIQGPAGMSISPHIGIKGIWDFKKAEIVDLTTGLAAGSDDLRARVEGGLAVGLSNGWSLNGEGFYDGIGADDLDAYGGSLKLTVPLN